jgi:hypothetical protein
MSAVGFNDATCLSCGSHIGWLGRYQDMPPCQDCGWEPDQESLSEVDAALEEARREIEAKIVREEVERQAALATGARTWFGEELRRWRTGQVDDVYRTSVDVAQALYGDTLREAHAAGWDWREYLAIEEGAVRVTAEQALWFAEKTGLDGLLDAWERDQRG